MTTWATSRSGMVVPVELVEAADHRFVDDKLAEIARVAAILDSDMLTFDVSGVKYKVSAKALVTPMMPEIKKETVAGLKNDSAFAQDVATELMPYVRQVATQVATSVASKQASKKP